MNGLTNELRKERTHGRQRGRGGEVKSRGSQQEREREGVD